MADVDNLFSKSVEVTATPDEDPEVTAAYDDEADAAQPQDETQNDESEPAVVEEGPEEFAD